MNFKALALVALTAATTTFATPAKADLSSQYNTQQAAAAAVTSADVQVCTAFVNTLTHYSSDGGFLENETNYGVQGNQLTIVDTDRFQTKDEAEFNFNSECAYSVVNLNTTYTNSHGTDYSYSFENNTVIRYTQTAGGVRRYTMSRKTGADFQGGAAAMNDWIVRSSLGNRR